MIHELAQLPQGLLQLELHYHLSVQSLDRSMRCAEHSQTIVMDTSETRSRVDTSYQR